MFLANGQAADQKDETLLAANGGTYDKSEACAPEVRDESTDDLSSVITQVTTRDVGSPRPPPTIHVERIDSRQTWRSKFKSIFCCFAPTGATATLRPLDQEPPQPIISLPIPPTPPCIYTDPLIGPKHPDDEMKKTLVLDLDETLVHSSFKPIQNPDYILPVEIDGKMVDVYVLKRPWLDHFMSAVVPKFEVVVFTASLAKYADPLLDLLDPARLVRWRLFRESCCAYQGNYVKDLNCLGRDLCDTIIVDNSPHSYIFQPFNAVPISTFIDNMDDQELLEITPTLLQLDPLSDVREYITQQFMSHPNHMHTS